MSEELAFAECDRLVREFEQVVKKPVKKRSPFIIPAWIWEQPVWF